MVTGFERKQKKKDFSRLDTAAANKRASMNVFFSPSTRKTSSKWIENSIEFVYWHGKIFKSFPYMESVCLDRIDCAVDIDSPKRKKKIPKINIGRNESVRNYWNKSPNVEKKRLILFAFEMTLLARSLSGQELYKCFSLYIRSPRTLNLTKTDYSSLSDSADFRFSFHEFLIALERTTCRVSHVRAHKHHH